MISEKLLSNVLNLNMWDTSTLIIKEDENKITWTSMFLGDIGFYNSSDSINIYELAYKCKEWALNYKYEINTALVIKINNPKDFYATALVVHPDKEERCDINSLTEPEAIFKACEWILKNDK